MSHSKRTAPTNGTAPDYTFEIYMSDGRIWRREGSLGNVPKIRITREYLQVGCTRVTREAFEKLMKEAADYWKDEGKDIQ